MSNWPDFGMIFSGDRGEAPGQRHEMRDLGGHQELPVDRNFFFNRFEKCLRSHSGSGTVRAGWSDRSYPRAKYPGWPAILLETESRSSQKGQLVCVSG